MKCDINTNVCSVRDLNVPWCNSYLDDSLLYVGKCKARF